MLDLLTNFDGRNIKAGAKGHHEDHAEPVRKQARKDGPVHQIPVEQAERPRELRWLRDGSNQSVVSSSLRQRYGKRNIKVMPGFVQNNQYSEVDTGGIVDCISNCRLGKTIRLLTHSRK